VSKLAAKDDEVDENGIFYIFPSWSDYKHH